MIGLAEQLLAGAFRIRPRDVGDYASISKKGMKFQIRAYTVAGIGNYSTITMSAMLGLMKMQTLVFTPLEKDAPLFSYDLIHAAGKDTLLLELYDTQLSPCDTAAMDLVKQRYSSLADHDLGTHWYDHLKLSPSLAKREKGKQAEFKALFAEDFENYVNLLRTAPACNPAAKREKTAAYVDGLFAHGGPSTDQFKKLLGEEKARDLFTRFIFSSAE